MNKARRFRNKLLKRIARTRALPPSPARDAQLEAERRRFMMSGGCKAVILRGLKRLKGKTDQQIFRLADRIDLSTSCDRPVRWRYKEKKSGGVRQICNPPITVRLGQLIARDLLIAQVTPDRCLYDWPGRGIHRHVADIRTALETVGLYAFTLDIRDCYEHVDIDNVYGLKLLPPELIRSSIDPRYLRFRQSHQVSESNLPYVVAHHNSTDPRGLLQGGSASSAIVVALLGNVSASFPSSVWGGGIADDFIVVGQDHDMVDDARGKLARYLTECPLGPSEFHWASVDVRVGFQHVGCLFMSIDEIVETLIPEGKLDALIERMTAVIRNPPPEESGRAVDHHVRKALGPYPWAVDWQREHVAECAAEACVLNSVFPG
ncbi:MAG: hypothetical protein ABI454_12015 [Sphingomicrobium sp.]